MGGGQRRRALQELRCAVQPYHGLLTGVRSRSTELRGALCTPCCRLQLTYEHCYRGACSHLVSGLLGGGVAVRWEAASCSKLRAVPVPETVRASIGHFAMSRTRQCLPGELPWCVRYSFDRGLVLGQSGARSAWTHQHVDTFKKFHSTAKASTWGCRFRLSCAISGRHGPNIRCDQ